MISTTPTLAPAVLLGMGGIDVRPAFGPGLCSGFAQYLAAPVNAPTTAAQGTGLSTVGSAVRLRPVARHAIGDVVETKNFVENTGTTLGNLSPGRPKS